MTQTLLERPGATSPPGPVSGRFRPSSRAKGRIAAGLLVAVLGVLINLAVYRGMNDTTAVLQLARDVPAGGQLSATDFRTVDLGSDDEFRAVAAADLAGVVGSYAKVRLVAGTLLASESLQSTPLVTPGAAVVAVTIPAGEVPAGLRERSPVRVVLVGDAELGSVEGVVVGLPASAGGAGGEVSVSVEVPDGDADRVVAADRVRLVLLEPGAGG